MAEFLQQVLNGVSLGSIYALIALGYTMVYGIIQLINFAHGEILMVGTYIGFFSITVLGLDLFSSLILSMAGAAVLGMLIERIAYKPLRNSTRLAALITAIGMSLFLQNTGLLVLGAEYRSFPQVIPNIQYRFFNGQVVITSRQILIFAVTVVMMVMLQYIVKRTKMGKAMRAVSLDKDAARLMGINVDTTISFTFALGSALAAVAGILLGIYYNTIHPLMGLVPGLKAFVAAVLGGIGVIPGAMAGGFLLGIIEALVSGYWSSMFRDAVAYGILILILLVKPSGLLGKDAGEKV
ncbi:branched-chain amino acid ABC transporter permease [Calderihabitans maritimus]|uniref:Inner-membrane translocator n=1 Tax=Calderihabitans maritimus TaxID=1246530 RepID=A0A1Z5HWF7_9FIRM|nr:branched-chain amino acid ABC transporter permease [Calderihabitans maritimus]GAW93671.1 inner-membrane translocator [Calderihabitans maritimus]